MRVRSPDMLLSHDHDKLLSRQLDNYMYAIGIGCIFSMLSATVMLMLI